MESPPADVRRAGRRMASRLRLDPADGESLAVQAWWEHPEFWSTVAWRRCVDEARHVYGDSRRGRQPHCAEDPLEGDLLRTLGGMDPALARVEDRDEVDRILALLPPREALVIREMDLRDRRAADIAADLGVCPSRVSQLHTAGLRHVRELMEESWPPGTS